MDAPAIRIVGLSKRYGGLLAVDNLDLEVSNGEVFGFLGLNGAGKTTTIRVLLDLIRPSAGKAFVLGEDCQSKGLRVRAQVGYLPGEIRFYGDMTGTETLDLLARLGPQSVAPHYRGQLLERMELSSADLRRRIREYSTGIKRKLGIVQAFQSDPALLILDEPTEGLDPLMQESFYQILNDAQRRGRTVFMSSHVLSEVERVCHRIGLIRKGTLALLSPVEEVRKLAARRVRVFFEREVDRIPARFPDGYEIVEIQPQCWTVRARGALGPLIDALAGLPVRDLEVEKPRLEDVLISYYREGTP